MVGKSTKKPKNFYQAHFTYYLSAPPARNSNYRERQLDQIIFKLLHENPHLLIASINTAPNGNQGVWVFITFNSLKKINHLLEIHD